MARVLYINDCHRDTTLASIGLRGRGHDFADAADGEDALEQARTFTPDCIVVNPNVAVLSGEMLLKQLREHTPNAAMIIIGCGLREQTVESMLGGGAHACLSRPFSIDELVSAVEQATSNEKLGAA